MLHYDHDELRTYCREVFQSISRSDQRRHAEIYLRGLVYHKGRKSVQRIAASVPGQHSGQSLQQFINQSPWDPQPVRRRTADLLTAHTSPTAWITEEVVFPKNGCYSAGVERQYVPALGRVINCQVGATIVLTSADIGVPVNWRLCLPQSWDKDTDRRSRAHIPPEEQHVPYCAHVINLIDEMTTDWGIPVAPIVSDISQHFGAEQLMSALENRSLKYIIQVNGKYQVASHRGGRRSHDMSIKRSWKLSAITHLGAAARFERRTIVWRDGPDGRPLRSQFIIFPIGVVDSRRSSATDRYRQALIEWPFSLAQPRAFWITNLTNWPIDDLVALTRLRWRAQQGIQNLAERFGLCHYEGRSFLGWHHHVTLASASYIFDVCRQRRQDAPRSVTGSAWSA